MDQPVTPSLFPVKGIFRKLFSEGVDKHIRVYAWLDYVSKHKTFEAYAAYLLARDKKETYPEPCQSPEEAHIICHNWIVDYVCPPNSRIIRLLEEAIVVISLFTERGDMSEFMTRLCGKGDRDNPQKFFYHQQNPWNPKGDAHRQFLDELRRGLLKLPVRRDDGEDAYPIKSWGDFKNILRKTIYQQLEDAEKPLQERELKDGMVASVVGPDNILSSLYRHIAGATSYVLEFHNEHTAEYLKLFDAQGTSFNPTALLGPELMSGYTASESLNTWTECAGLLTEAIQNSVEKHDFFREVSFHVSRMITLSGYGPAVNKYKANRIRAFSADLPLDPACASRETANCKFIQGEQIDRVNYNYILDWLEKAREMGGIPQQESSAETKKRLAREIRGPKTAAEQEQKTTDFSTVMLFGVGALVLFVVMR